MFSWIVSSFSFLICPLLKFLRPVAPIKSRESHKLRRRIGISKVSVKADFAEIERGISKLTEDEKEALFFELNPAWGKALEKMEKEAIREDEEGKTVNLEDI